jgi:hypothetical protein
MLKSVFYKGIGLLLILVLAACQSLAGEDVPATLAVEMTAYATQVAVLREEAQMQRTAVLATISFAETQAAAYLNYNNILVATVRAGQIATPEQRIVAAINQSSMPDAMMMAEGQGTGEIAPENLGAAVRVGEMQFTAPILTAAVRPEDRCANGIETTFSASTTPVVYLVTVAANLTAGTRIEVDWRYENQRVFLGFWEPSEPASQLCIAMELGAERVNFRPGNWTATLLVDGVSSGAVAFTMVE